MDKPTPDGPNASNPPWPEDSGSGQDFGATGVFGTMKPPDPLKGLALDSGAESDAQRSKTPEAIKPSPALAMKSIAEPVVHKVVFGGGAAGSSPELLDRMRKASAERSLNAENAPATEPGHKGSAGFTELLRTLGSESPAPPTGATGFPAPEAPHPASDSGFTSLLRTLSMPEGGASTAEELTKTMQAAVRTIPAEPAKAPAASGAGGFTELLRATPMEGEEPGGPPPRGSASRESPVTGGAAGATPPSVGNQPGAFTQLFGTFGGAGVSPQAPVDRGPAESPPASSSSFTKMLSLEQQSVPAAAPFREELKPSAGSMDFGLVPGGGRPTAANVDPFSPAPLAETPPNQSTPVGGGAGITRLIQMLDEPSTAPPPRIEVAPASTPRGAEPGVWTQTFASLAAPNETATPLVKAPAQPLGRIESPVSRDAGFPGAMNEPRANPPAAVPGTSGPSEFTRILDASRIREQAMRGGQAAVGGSSIPPPTPQSFAPPPVPTPVPMPTYQPPTAPPMGTMPGMGGMPQPGGYAPPQPSQAPGMYAPAPPPMPAPPPVPPMKPAEPGLGKLQQYVPLLLVLVIVLLVVLLVTVVFLLKH